MIPNELTVTDLAAANTAGRAWMGEVNTVEHSQIVAVPTDRLDTERPLLGPLPSLRAQIGKLVVRKVDRLSCVRFGSVPTRHIANQVEVRVVDGRLRVVFLGNVIADHPVVPPRGIVDHRRPLRRTPTRPHRRAVRPKTKAKIAFCALERAVAFGRFRASDVRSILAAGTGVPAVTEPGSALVAPLPVTTIRSLADYAIEESS